MFFFQKLKPADTHQRIEARKQKVNPQEEMQRQLETLQKQAIHTQMQPQATMNLPKGAEKRGKSHWFS
jgi:hypothetical protein